MKNYKFILDELQQKVNSITTKQTTHYSNALLYDIIFYIQGRLSVDYKKDDKKSIVIYSIEFEKKLGISYDTFTKYIKLLISEKIIWRNKLSYETNDGIKKRKAYRYDIHYSIVENITSLTHFVYTTIKSYNLLKEEVVEIKNEIQQVTYNNLQKLSIDYNNSLKELNDSNLSKDSKINQAYNVYRISLKKYNISQTNKKQRIYNTITNVNKTLHRFLYIDGYQVSEIDAKQSQLVLLSTLIKDIDIDFYNDLNIERRYIYDDIIKYYNGFNVELKYLDSNKIIKTINSKKLTKDIVKPLVYGAVFGGFDINSYHRNPTILYFELTYPKMIKYVRDTFKKEDSLSKKLQEIESSIWLLSMKQLKKKNVTTISKHDSLFFKYTDRKIVIEILTKNFKRKGIDIKNSFDFGTYLAVEYKQPIQLKNFDKPYISILTDYKSELNNNKTNKTIYTFINKDGKEFIGIKNDFVMKYKLNISGVNKLIRKFRKSYKGWTIKNN